MTGERATVDPTRTKRCKCGRRVWYYDTGECGSCGGGENSRGRRGGWDSDPARDKP